MRLLIADDEKLVRYHIRSLAMEAEPSLEIIEAENGKELVEFIASGRVDAAFVDIRMPKMNGLEAMLELEGKGRSVPWAVLSSHSEFAYAKRALELGALGYALKPPSLEEVAELVAKLRSAINRIREEKNAAFERDWRRLAVDESSPMPSAAEGSVFAAALLAADGTGAASAAGAALAAIARLIVERSLKYAERGLRAAAFARPEERMIEVAVCVEPVGASLPDMDAIRRFWAEIASAAAAVECDPGRTARITIATAECACSAAEARRGLEATRVILDRRALLQPGVIDHRTAENQLATFGAADLDAAVSMARAVTCVATRDRVALRSAAAAFAAAAAEIDERAIDLLRRFIGRSLSSEAAPSSLSDPSGAALIAVCEKAMEGDGAIIGSADGDTIAAVEDFVRRRFAERLSLAETARIFGLTPNYLSALFHKKIGMTFVEYATELRLTRGRELLRSGKSVKEAAWAVGYGSERHFARLYRERFGSPPAAEKRAKS